MPRRHDPFIDRLSCLKTFYPHQRRSRRDENTWQLNVSFAMNYLRHFCCICLIHHTFKLSTNWLDTLGCRPPLHLPFTIKRLCVAADLSYPLETSGICLSRYMKQQNVKMFIYDLLKRWTCLIKVIEILSYDIQDFHLYCAVFLVEGGLNGEGGIISNFCLKRGGLLEKDA